VCAQPAELQPTEGSETHRYLLTMDNDSHMHVEAESEEAARTWAEEEGNIVKTVEPWNW
jgi:hypothetical protein